MKPSRAASFDSTGIASSRLPSTTSTCARQFADLGAHLLVVRRHEMDHALQPRRQVAIGRGRADGERLEKFARRFHVGLPVAAAIGWPEALRQSAGGRTGARTAPPQGPTRAKSSRAPSGVGSPSALLCRAVRRARHARPTRSTPPVEAQADAGRLGRDVDEPRLAVADFDPPPGGAEMGGARVHVARDVDQPPLPAPQRLLEIEVAEPAVGDLQRRLAVGAGDDLGGRAAAGAQR